MIHDVLDKPLLLMIQVLLQQFLRNFAISTTQLPNLLLYSEFAARIKHIVFIYPQPTALRLLRKQPNEFLLLLLLPLLDQQVITPIGLCHSILALHVLPPPLFVNYVARILVSQL